MQPTYAVSASMVSEITTKYHHKDGLGVAFNGLAVAARLDLGPHHDTPPLNA
jgi:hypothetical protein